MCWKGHALLFEHQVPQNTLIQPPEHQPPPFLFSPCLTLNCKLTAGEEIEPASHGHTPECDFTQDLATQLCCSLGFPTVPRSHHTQPMSQACGHLLKKPILGAEPGNLAVFNTVGTRRGSPPGSFCGSSLGCSARAHLPTPHHKLAGTPQ